MLYDEFVKGTGCRETEKNYQVYKELEALYMNSNLSKDEVYTLGKMRVDNGLTDKEKDEIKDLETVLDEWIENSQYYENYIYHGTYKEIAILHKSHIKDLQIISRNIKELKEQIKAIKDRAK